jgi:hypothetical protein
VTTKVHVVNFGPDVVEVDNSQCNCVVAEITKIYPQQSADFTVWKGKDVIVREIQTKN